MITDVLGENFIFNNWWWKCSLSGSVIPCPLSSLRNIEKAISKIGKANRAKGITSEVYVVTLNPS